MNVFSRAVISASLPLSFPAIFSLSFTTIPLTVPPWFILVAPQPSVALNFIQQLHELIVTETCSAGTQRGAEALHGAWNRILLKLTETFILQSICKAKT